MRFHNSRLAASAFAATVFVSFACGGASQSQTRASGPKVSSASGDDVVATVGGQEITLAELDEKVKSSNMEVFQKLYEARRQVLGELVAESLLEQEAASRGITRDELVEAEIASKTPPVTDDQVETFYEQNKAQLRGQTLEQIGGQIREFMVARNEATARQAYIDRLTADADIDIQLDPPRTNVQVAESERVRGPDDAEVTIVEYSDFQ